MSRKRIAVITARADDPEQKEILCGIAEAALSADADVIVYSNIYNHWVEDENLNYENIIYSLFEPRHFNGAIITAEAFRDISVLDNVVDKIKNEKLPAVVIGGEIADFASVYSDDESDMEFIAEHLINHGFTDIDILTGFKGDKTAERRAEGCKKALMKHGIPFDESKLHYGDSCPCGVVQSQLAEELNTERLHQYYTIISNVAQFSSRLTACKTLAEYIAVLSEFFYLLHGTERIYLCLDSEWGGAKFSGEEYLCCMVSADEVCAAPERVSADNLPPVFSEKCGVYYFTPLCYQTRLFGYTVLRYAYPTGYDFSFRDWSKTVADTLELLRMKNDIHYLTQCQRASSLYDSLTGFYNLREFRQIAEEMQNCSMYAIKLGYASDGEFVYGENNRNDIVSAAAGAIKKSCTRHEICCRANDDVFLILCKGGEDTLSEKLDVMLFNALGGFDERQAVISRAMLDGGSIDELFTAVEDKSEQEITAVRERMSLQHYNALLELRKGLIDAPQKALTLSEASRRLCVSAGYLRSVYRECFGVSYNQDCINARLMKACFMLITTAMSIYAVAVNCGYNDEKFFARQFGKFKGCSPMEYRKRYADML